MPFLGGFSGTRARARGRSGAPVLGGRARLADIGGRRVDSLRAGHASDVPGLLTPGRLATLVRRLDPMSRSIRYLAALCLSLVGADAAAAGPGWLELRWPAVADCPTQAEVEAIAVRLANSEAPQPVAAQAELREHAGGYTLELRVRDSGGEQQRTLHSPRCEALGEATAVILAVAAAPLEVAAQVLAARDVPPLSLLPEPPRIDPVEVVEPGPPVLAQAPASAAPARSPSRVRPGLALGVGATAAIGPSQRFAPGLSGTLTLLWPRARLDVRGSGWFRSSVPIAEGVRADLRLAAGAVRGCPRLLRRAFALDLCGGLELGALLAEGVGLEVNERRRGLWAAGLLALGVQWRPLRRLALGLEAEGLVAFTRRQYATGDVGEVFYRVPPVGLRLGGGIAVQIF